MGTSSLDLQKPTAALQGANSPLSLPRTDKLFPHGRSPLHGTDIYKTAGGIRPGQYATTLMWLQQLPFAILGFVRIADNVPKIGLFQSSKQLLDALNPL
jgi:hypothetical protein